MISPKRWNFSDDKRTYTRRDKKRRVAHPKQMTEDEPKSGSEPQFAEILRIRGNLFGISERTRGVISTAPRCVAVSGTARGYINLFVA